MLSADLFSPTDDLPARTSRFSRVAMTHKPARPNAPPARSRPSPTPSLATYVQADRKSGYASPIRPSDAYVESRPTKTAITPRKRCPFLLPAKFLDRFSAQAA